MPDLDMPALLGGVDEPISVRKLVIYLRNEIFATNRLLDEVAGIDDPPSARALDYATMRLTRLCDLIETLFEIEVLPVTEPSSAPSLVVVPKAGKL
jgi:hypothetical protein